MQLDSLFCPNRSRHKDKLEEINARAAIGQNSYPVRLQGIYSYETLRTYKEHCANYSEWVKETFQDLKIRDLESAKPYFSQYLQHRLEQGDSAWTLKLIRSALKKVYQDPKLADDVNLPVRKKENIIRSRGQKPMDKKFSPERNRDLVDFCRATGLRRHELQSLKVIDVYQVGDRLQVDVHQGKGGKFRSVPVLKQFESRIEEIISNKDLSSQLFDKIPVRADIHSYRREYAASYYKELSGKNFNPKEKDKDVIRLVSKALGHNRLDVVTRNYLD